MAYRGFYFLTHKNGGDPHSFTTDNHFLSILWGLQLLPKIKVFKWRVFSRTLGQGLIFLRVWKLTHVNARDARGCGEKYISSWIVHMRRKHRNWSVWMLRKKANSWADFLFFIRERGAWYMGKIVMVLWGLWSTWCSYVFQEKVQSDEAFVSGVFNFLEQFTVTNGLAER